MDGQLELVTSLIGYWWVISRLVATAAVLPTREDILAALAASGGGAEGLDLQGLDLLPCGNFTVQLPQALEKLREVWAFVTHADPRAPWKQPPPLH